MTQEKITSGIIILISVGLLALAVWVNWDDLTGADEDDSAEVEATPMP